MHRKGREVLFDVVLHVFEYNSAVISHERGMEGDMSHIATKALEKYVEIY